MATVALFPESALVYVVVGMTTVAAGRCVAIVVVGPVTIQAACAQMRPDQREVGPTMVEQAAADRDDIGVPALVIRVTGYALVTLCGWKSSVKPGHRFAIGADILMATHAQCRNRLVGSCVMAGAAVTLDVSVTFNDAARHQEPFDTGCKRRFTG